QAPAPRHQWRRHVDGVPGAAGNWRLRFRAADLRRERAPPLALLHNRKNGLYISAPKHRTGADHNMESVVTPNATAQVYEPRYIRLNANDNVAIVVNDLGLPAKTR